MTILEDLANNAPESAITLDGGERFISLTGENAVTVDELKDLKGYEFYHPQMELVLKKVNSVKTEIYENVDGRFLALTIEATFLITYDEETFQQKDTFTIWVSDEDGGVIEAGNFESMQTGCDVDIDPEAIDPVLSRFEL